MAATPRRPMGRPRKYPASLIVAVRALAARGLQRGTIARLVHVPCGTVWYLVHRAPLREAGEECDA